MINQISSSNNNVFSPLQSNGVPYAITKPFTEKQKKTLKKEEEEHENKLGANIAKVALVTGFGVFALMKGLPKGTKTKIGEFFKYLNAIHLSGNSKQLSGAQKYYYKVLKFTKPLVDHLNALFTLSSLKDVLFKKVFGLTPSLNKISDKLTAVFEKVSIGTSRRAYMKTLNHSEKMFADFAEANNIVRAKNSTLADTLNVKTGKIRNHYIDGFTEAARNQRFLETKRNMDKGGVPLHERLWDDTYGNLKRFLTNRESYTTFISEELVKDAKTSLGKDVRGLREGFSISFTDNYNDARHLIKRFSRSAAVDPTDAATTAVLKNLRINLLNAKKSGTFNGEHQRLILADLKKLSGKFPKSEELKKCIDVVSKNKQGEIQNIMNEYRRILPPKDYARLEKSVNRTLNSLDRSIDLETDKLFDKVRDLKIGSAPHDTMAVLASLGVVGWGLSKAENNDEKISVALKYGIPAIGAISTSLLFTVGLVPAGPSLVYGLIAGAAINKLGEVLDEARKKYNENKPIVSLPNVDISSPMKNIKEIKNNS